MSVFKEKLNKFFYKHLAEIGFTEPKPVQQKALARINGGTDTIVIAPAGSGKSTTLALSVINRLREAFEDAPRALILLPDPDKVMLQYELYQKLCKYTDLRVRVAHDAGKIDKQGEDIYYGADIVLGTPKRVFELYLKQNLNLNKLKVFAMDEPEFLTKGDVLGQIDRLLHSLPKCQHVALTADYNEKVDKLLSKFMIAPAEIESEE